MFEAMARRGKVPRAQRVRKEWERAREARKAAINRQRFGPAWAGPPPVQQRYIVRYQRTPESIYLGRKVDLIQCLVASIERTGLRFLWVLSTLFAILLILLILRFVSII